MKAQTFLILGVIVLIIVAVFAVTNVAVVSVNYFFWSGESPLILVILVSVLMGVIISAAVGSYRLYHVQRELKNLKTKNDLLEKELSNQPVAHQPIAQEIEMTKETPIESPIEESDKIDRTNNL